jgi:hypothetical protein
VYSGIEFRTARQAIQHAAANGSRAIRLEGRILVVSQKDADQLEVSRVAFCYLGVHKGRVMTVPVNND